MKKSLFYLMVAIVTVGLNFGFTANTTIKHAVNGQLKPQLRDTIFLGTFYDGGHTFKMYGYWPNASHATITSLNYLDSNYAEVPVYSFGGDLIVNPNDPNNWIIWAHVNYKINAIDEWTNYTGPYDDF